MCLLWMKSGEKKTDCHHGGCECRNHLSIMTTHGNNVEEMKKRPLLNQILKQQVFDRYIELSRREGPGTVASIMDGNGEPLHLKKGLPIMIKIVGAVFILGATTWAGFEASKRLSDRPRQLRLFRNSLANIGSGNHVRTHTSW